MRPRLLLTTDAVGGVWTYALDLARALAAADDTITFLAVLGPGPSAGQLTDAAAVPGLHLINTALPLDWTAAEPAEIRSAAAVLAGLAAEAEVHRVQLHTPALAVADYCTPVVSVVHSCVATWWAAVRTGPLPADLAWRADLVREGLDRSDLAIAPTRAFAEAIAERYGLRHLPEVVHNGRAPGAVASGGEPAPFALTAGRLWDAGKNVAAFDRAAALASVPFRAAGPLTGPDGSAATLAYAEALGALSTEALAGLLAQRPIFVSPALYEPFGLAVLEAAQAGCALVLADRRGFRELWEGAALFVSPEDERAIADAVDHLLASPATRQTLGGAARARSAELTPQAMASAMRRLTVGLTLTAHRAAA
jgi:glycosyltransferase involved in cell wall biosynthesis